MDVSMSAFAGGVADVLSGNISFLTTAEFPNAWHSSNFTVDTSFLLMADENVKEGEVGETSVSTILMNFANEFDPYDASSAPLYQTATFKQVPLTAIWCLDKNLVNLEEK